MLFVDLCRYDRDRDGFLDRGDFERLLMDVNRTTMKAIQVYVDEVRSWKLQRQQLLLLVLCCEQQMDQPSLQASASSVPKLAEGRTWVFWPLASTHDKWPCCCQVHSQCGWILSQGHCLYNLRLVTPQLIAQEA
jgi:hypothetical protein